MFRPSPGALHEIVVDHVRASGPITFAEYMELALYHPDFGYYSRADRRSGRAGDFYTSVDVGPAFGSLLAKQFEGMWRLIGGGPLCLVEAAAGDGRLARDVLDAAATEYPDFYRHVQLVLVERSAAARAAQPATLAPHDSKLVASSADLPPEVRGVIFANELLDALPAHAVVMRPGGLQEIFVAVRGEQLVEEEGPLSTGAIVHHLDSVGASLPQGCRAEVGLRATAWVSDAARRITSGFLVIIDYGHDARELYSASHAAGTAAAFRRHTVADPAGVLNSPGEYDLTVHVDLTAVRQAAEGEGLETVAMLDQTYFLLGLGAADRFGGAGSGVADLKRRLALKTLIMPGGLGSTHKAMIFSRGLGTPALAGTSYGVRLT